MSDLNDRRIKFAVGIVRQTVKDMGLNDDDEGYLDIVGSTYISDKELSDVDVLVYAKGFDVNEHGLSGWEFGGSVGLGNDDWASWKRMHYLDGAWVEVNLLLTGDKELYNQWVTAADVCRFLHLSGVQLTRGQVHGVHSLIMHESDMSEMQVEAWQYV